MSGWGPSPNSDSSHTESGDLGTRGLRPESNGPA